MMITRDLVPYARHFREYTELRVQENRTTRIFFINGKMVQNSRSALSGVSARVNISGSWGFASNPTMSPEIVKQVIQAATENAHFLESREKIKKKLFPANSATADYHFSTSKEPRTHQELIAFVEEIDDHIQQQYPRLSSRTVGLGCLDMEKSLLTSEKSQAYSLLPRTSLIINLVVEKNGEPFELYDVIEGHFQFEDSFPDLDHIYQGIRAQYDHLLHKAEGIHPQAGFQECILDAQLTGTLAHEAIGHTTEADHVLAGSIAGYNLDKEVASPMVTLVDFAHTAQQKLCPMPIFVDDEGTKAEDVVIIERGILKSFLHNKESAQHFQAQPTGNARAFRFSDEPLIRMRNTALLAGKHKLEEMISSIDQGYYLMKSGNGQADTTSEFMFGVVLGYEISKGKIGRALRDTTISGVAFDILKTVSMVSDDMIWQNSGMCGKKQPLPVGMGGPAIKCSINVAGR
ncbi:TldD/PmbA family protein [candidate division CSSED10-310 bacterium]|uniref:TldD/PmbA family protein n=1 Tax=candidate division CSSED10-310 bacterium TaxID=2855610 RepID=A0ABV6YWM6_UNCC1